MVDFKTASPDAQVQDSTNGTKLNGHHAPPRPLPVITENVPPQLKALWQWVLWRYEKVDGKYTKVPHMASGRRASSTSFETWTTFDKACKAYQTGKFDGIGFVVTKECGIVGVDIDHHRDPQTGIISDAANAAVMALNSYAEASPSGTGLRIWVIGELPAGRRKNGDFEVYDSGRFLTFTGHRIEGTPADVIACNGALTQLHAKHIAAKPKASPVKTVTPIALVMDDQTIVDKALNAKNSNKFAALWSGDIGAYKSASEAELAFCDLLAFWTRDPAQIERIWLASGLQREKTQREDYRNRTIQRSLETVTNTYDPSPRALRAPDPGKVANGDTDTRPDPLPEDEQLTITEGYPLTDTGNGERFISQHGKRVLYCAALGWFVWNDHYYEPDENNTVFELGKRTVRSIYTEAGKAPDDGDRIKIAAWAKGSESLARRNAMIEIASKDGKSIKIQSNQLDTHKMLFNVQNGTIDLETGQLLPPNRDHRLTKASPVIYDPRADAPAFFRFLSVVLDNDLEAAEFLQRFMGYTLTGLTREHCFLILHGIGSNGKSTFLNVLRWLLGPYCKQTKPDTLMKKKFGDGIPNDVAMLRGARMVTAIETNEGRQFDEAKIKEMTGGDPVTARFFRKEFFEFEPEFKLYLATNHKPTIVGDDEGIWRRVRLMPFNVHFWNPDKGETGPAHLMADKTLADKLKTELPGILNWALMGCLEWQKNGLPEPRVIADATATYRTESDPVETFLSERCFREPHCEVGNAQLYGEFLKWANSEDEPELSNKAFTARMKQKGFENTRGTGGLRKWKGVGLLDIDSRGNVYKGAE